MKFKIGDRVRAIKPCDGNERIVGKTGTVIAFGDKFSRGVEFDEHIDGHSCSSYGESGYCWWCLEETLEPIEDNKKIVITTDGKTTTAKLYDGKKVIKSAKTKCCPEDKFDFETGAKIAFDRLILAKEKTLHLMRGSDDCGEVGKPTELKDINGERLYVGDVVELFDKELSSRVKRFIANSPEHGDFVMGIAYNSGTKYNHGKITGGWRIIKRKSYKDCKSGDIIGLLTVVEN